MLKSMPVRRLLMTGVTLSAVASLFFSADFAEAARARKPTVTWTSPRAVRRTVIPGQSYELTLNYRISGTEDIESGQASISPTAYDSDRAPVFTLSADGSSGTFGVNTDLANILASGGSNSVVLSVTIPITPTKRSYNTTVRVKENLAPGSDKPFYRTLNRPLTVINRINYAKWKQLKARPTPTRTPEVIE